MPPITFSLISHPWIPCEVDGQELVLLSLREIFDGSRYVRAVRCETAAESYALLRLLLVIFWRARSSDDVLRGRDADRFFEWWGDAYREARQNRPDEAVLDYLERHADRFDLFGPTPFMQVAALETTSGRVGEARRLLPDSESDYFGVRSGHSLESLTLPEAARAVVTIQAYDYSGIKSGAAGDPRVKGGKGYPIGTGWAGMTGGVVIHGETLRETLVLNTVADEVLIERDTPDLAVWERLPNTAAQRYVSTPTGPCDLATWQSRRVRLIAEGERVTGAIVSNGDQIPDAGANQFGDPMTAYRYSKNKSTKVRPVHYPRPHDAELTLWRSLAPLLMREGMASSSGSVDQQIKIPRTIEHLHRLREGGELSTIDAFEIELVSLSYGAQSSSIADSINLRLELPVELVVGADPSIVHMAVTASSVTQECATAVGQFAGALAQAAGGEYSFDENRKNEFLDSLEPRYREWLRTVGRDDSEDHLDRWLDAVRSTALTFAHTLLRSAGPRALIGRTVNERDRERVVSAGSAHSHYLSKVNTILPKRNRQKETTNVE